MSDFTLEKLKEIAETDYVQCGDALSCRQLTGLHPGIYQYVTKAYAELIGRNYKPLH